MTTVEDSNKSVPLPEQRNSADDIPETIIKCNETSDTQVDPANPKLVQNNGHHQNGMIMQHDDDNTDLSVRLEIENIQPENSNVEINNSTNVRPDESSSGGVHDGDDDHDKEDDDDDGDSDDEVEILEPRWRTFQFQDHSLAVSASRVAACAGYDYYMRCPELMFQHVYQGRGGNELLKHDAELLGLTLVDTTEEEELLELAKHAGEATLKKVKEVVKVKRGEKTLHSVDNAEHLRQAVLAEATKSNKLSKHQLKQLEEGTRQSVHTGCGQSWEDYALDQYEKQCGWEVYSRNLETRHWKLEKVDDYEQQCSQNVDPNRTDDDDDGNHRQRKKQRVVGDDVPSLRPIGVSSVPSSSFGRNKTESEHDSSNPLGKNDDADIVTKRDNDDTNSALNKDTLSSKTTKPYVIIKGRVDGIRDELAPVLGSRTDDNDIDDDDSWAMRRVIVECKHRMKNLLSRPRLSEEIQAVLYCLMYDTEEADVIQALRTKSTKPITPVGGGTDPQKGRKVVSNDSKVEETGKRSITDYFASIGTTKVETKPMTDESKKTSSNTEVEKDETRENNTVPNNDDDDDDKATTKQADVPDDDRKIASTTPPVPEPVTMKMVTTRISLMNNDTTTTPTITTMTNTTTTTNSSSHHLVNFNTYVLPNLRQWVDAVYRIRRSDDKRYLLLRSMTIISEPNNDFIATTEEEDEYCSSSSIVEDDNLMALRTAWNIVIDECPFLKEGISGSKYVQDCFPNTS